MLGKYINTELNKISVHLVHFVISFVATATAPPTCDFCIAQESNYTSWNLSSPPASTASRGTQELCASMAGEVTVVKHTENV